MSYPSALEQRPPHDNFLSLRNTMRPCRAREEAPLCIWEHSRQLGARNIGFGSGIGETRKSLFLGSPEIIRLKTPKLRQWGSHCQDGIPHSSRALRLPLYKHPFSSLPSHLAEASVSQAKTRVCFSRTISLSGFCWPQKQIRVSSWSFPRK